MPRREEHCLKTSLTHMDVGKMTSVKMWLSPYISSFVNQKEQTLISYSVETRSTQGGFCLGLEAAGDWLQRAEGCQRDLGESINRAAK
ncbi:hypothetical protein VFPPC_16876 [Pochonia chlamydosporia 170]|uniref:Uncharacterized protein n=1 Tax=Pochonia chlamydosporia 170 TaxID=1380566 RepID=A0A179F1V2_METCM|nr:hypothetical protein VFPPC_16876 [Pochonia chlamydosporia 170]OAQ59434.1 hypothetical protein VFPPC_16876 [Pochonia chlamydosporia 170]